MSTRNTQSSQEDAGAGAPVWRPTMTRFWMRFSILFALLCSMLLGVGKAQVQPRRVLILYEVGTAYPGINLIDQGIRDTLDGSPFKLEIYREYMDSVLFPDPASQQRIREFITRKYHDRGPDVIITAGPTPLKFMEEMHDNAFPGVPIAFCLPYFVPRAVSLDSHFTGVLNELNAAETIQAAVRLQPGTKRIIVVGGTSFNDHQIENVVKEQLRPLEGDFAISYLTSLSMTDLLKKLHHLPDHTIVLFSSLSQDATGAKYISGNEATSMVAAAANAPVFGMIDVFLNHGEVGGKVSSFREQGRLAAELALRILSGEKPQDIPKVNAGTVPMFDWRALKRWGFKESALPPGSIVLNRQPGFWELYKKFVVVAILVLLAQTVAILGLLRQRARRRKTEADLRRSEEKFARSFRDSPLAISIVSTQGDRYLEVNETFEQLTGWKAGEIAGRCVLDVNLWVDPDQRRPFLEKLLSNRTVRDVEVKIRRKDGEIRTTLGSAELIEVDRELCVLSVFADITERKLAEEALSTVSRRLISAQEQERVRIARELHDDINQRIAMLCVEFGQLEQSDPHLGREHRSRLTALQKRLLELGIEVQAISHRLHSSKLEYLGLAVACKSFCNEVAKRHEVSVDFTATDVPRKLPHEVSICVFRVLQESLNNAIKYSGVQHFAVQLHGVSDEIQLTVRDHGVGFDAESSMSGQGLGLISMRERVHLVNGTISIKSRPESGTEISVNVPLVSAENVSEMASGAA